MRIGYPESDPLLQGDLAYWRLCFAPEPRSIEHDNDRVPVGRQHPLVGKPAPSFTLPDLDNNIRSLQEFTGKVVVLDFWATWCGPYLLIMPQIEKVVSTFGDHACLIAVNLQEPPDRIRPVLGRLKISPLVLVDEDGAVAAKYRATAILLTVVIDRQGPVTRIFVGGGHEIVEQLTSSLQELVNQAGP